MQRRLSCPSAQRKPRWLSVMVRAHVLTISRINRGQAIQMDRKKEMLIKAEGTIYLPIFRKALLFYSTVLQMTMGKRFGQFLHHLISISFLSFFFCLFTFTQRIRSSVRIRCLYFVTLVLAYTRYNTNNVLLGSIQMEYVATLFNQETTYHKYTEIQIIDDGCGSLCLLDLAPPTFLWALGSHMPNRRLKCSVKWSIHVHCSFFCLKFYCLRWHHCFSLFQSL